MKETTLLKLLTIAVLSFAALTLGAMAAISLRSSDERPAAQAAPGALDPRAAREDAPPSAPLLVLPPVPAPHVAPPQVEVITAAPPPPVAAEAEQHAAQLLSLREVRRGSAMDQLNAREALRRQRLGLPPPAPLAPRPAAQESARP